MNILVSRSVILLGFLACAATASAQTFTDASHLLLERNRNPSIGASLVDINQDGRVDIYQRETLYMQQVDGTFSEKYTDLGFPEESGAVFGALFGDYNEDGFPDLFFMDLIDPGKLYRNRAGMTFVASNEETGITDQTEVQGSVWTDFDQDGLIDLFIGVDFGVSSLFLNGEHNQFTNIAPRLGFTTQAVYGVAAADFDRDGDVDIFFTQCIPLESGNPADNHLLRNDDGMLQNISAQAGIVDDLASWGTVWLDYNNDGWLDIYTVNIDHRDTRGKGQPGINTLHRNNEGLNFIEVAMDAGVAGDSSDSTFGVSAADFDNDGWTDLFVINRSSASYLYRNLGDGTFENILPDINVTPVASQSVAVADVNDDGWVDIYVPAFAPQLFLNEGGTNHFLKIHARGTGANLFGIGARIDLYAGELHQVREIVAGDGLTSQNHNLSAHFGLGTAPVVDSLVVSWPGGGVDRLFAIEADQTVTLVEGVGINNPPAPFMLEAPAGGVPFPQDSLSFFWSPSSDETGEALSYSLYVFGAGLDTTLTDLSGSPVKLASSLFTAGAAYRWTVSVTDGYSMRSAGYLEFSPGDATDVDDPVARWPDQPALLPPYPNPFGSSITLPYRVNQAAHVQIEVFDLLGHSVTRLIDQEHAPNSYEIVWDGRTQQGVPVAPGVYAVQMQLGNKHLSHIIVHR